MHPPPIFFVHIMKTGGSAVRERLAALFAKEATYPDPGNGGKLRYLNIDLLLGRTSEDQKSTLLYTAHMPAWVATKVAPDHLHVSVLREPVARTVSHLRHIARALDIRRLEDIYDDSSWQSRLTNYQTRIFSLRQIDWERLKEQRRNKLAQSVAASNEISHTPHLGKRWANMDFQHYTAMDFTTPIDEKGYAAAIQMIDSFDLVGVTEKLEGFFINLSDLSGVQFGVAKRINIAPNKIDVSKELLDRIRQDNLLDRRLYKYILDRWI